MMTPPYVQRFERFLLSIGSQNQETKMEPGMKKIAVLLLAAGMLCAVPGGANAIDFSAKGRWAYNFGSSGFSVGNPCQELAG